MNLDETSGCNSPTFVVVNGNLQMGNGRKMNFAAGSTVQIMPGGNLFKGPGGGHSNEINITGATSWIAGDGSKLGYFLIGTILPLPVEFKVFNVEKNEKGLKLYWIVNSEKNNNFFHVEFSVDGESWSSFEHVKSIGDHSSEYTYELTNDHLKIAVDIVYFRLSQIDNDGKRRELAIQSLKLKKNTISIFPNPTKLNESVRFNVQSDKQIESKVLIFNATGQLILSDIVFFD